MPFHNIFEYIYSPKCDSGGSTVDGCYSGSRSSGYRKLAFKVKVVRERHFCI